LSVEGAENGEWIVVDCGAAVAHIMQPAIRDYYRLEEIWGGKSVKMKIDGGDSGLVKAEASDSARPSPAARAPRKTTANASAAGRRVGAGQRSAQPPRKGGASKAVSSKAKARKTPSRGR
jgi:ribosome-associated protein